MKPVRSVLHASGLLVFLLGGCAGQAPRGPAIDAAQSFIASPGFDGVVLIADGFDHHVPKGYVYFAMVFAVAVELLNIRMRKRAVRLAELHERYTRDSE